MDIDTLVEEMKELKYEPDPDALTAQSALILYKALVLTAPKLLTEGGPILRLLSAFDEVTGGDE